MTIWTSTFDQLLMFMMREIGRDRPVTASELCCLFRRTSDGWGLNTTERVTIHIRTVLADLVERDLVERIDVGRCPRFRLNLLALPIAAAFKVRNSSIVEETRRLRSRL